MAQKYDGPDSWLDGSTVPWGETDYVNPEKGKVDSLRKSLWGTNRAANGAWRLISEVAGSVRDLAKAVAGLSTELVRIRTYVARIEKKVDSIAAKLDSDDPA